MSARTGIRPTASRIGPRRPIRPGGGAVPSFRPRLRGRPADPPPCVGRRAPRRRLVHARVRDRAHVGRPDAVVLLGAPLYAAALLLSGGAALVAGTLVVAFTVPLLGPPGLPLIEISGFGEVLTIVVSAVALRRSWSSPSRPARKIFATRRGWPSSVPPSSACSRRRRAGSAGQAPSRRWGGRSSRRPADHRLPQRPGLRLEPGGDVIPIAFEGVVGAYEQVDFDLLRCHVGEGFTGWVAEHGLPILVGDANLDPRGATIPGTDDVDESMLVVPMAYDGVTVGVITLSKLGIDQFDLEDERLLLILADQAATAIETARLLARSQALAGELRGCSTWAASCRRASIRARSRA
jgi:hypothetical protein